jgi:hypothetical protein
LHGIDLAVGHAIPVEAVAGLAGVVQADHRQRGGLVGRFHPSQLDAGPGDAFGQAAAKPVTRQGVEVERAHALQTQCAGEVVDRPPVAGAQAAIGLLDQVDQGFSSGGDMHRLVWARENHK